MLPLCLKYREQLGWTNTVMGELYAFIGFAQAYPDSFSSLVDSYSTLDSGIKNYLIVALVLKDLGYEAKGIRLDSGDLAKLSIECKRIMKETGEKFGHDFSKMNIVASNDINETTLNELKDAGH